MKFGLCLECYECRLNKYVYDVNLPEKEKEIFVKKQLERIAKAPEDMSTSDFYKLIQEEYNKVFVPLNFDEIKAYYNNLLLNQVEKLEKEIEESEDPLYHAIQLALVANYIDFAAFSDVSEERLFELLNDSYKKDIDKDAYRSFKEDLHKIKKLLYITDNCGEVVLDKLLIKQILKMNPDIEATVMVRGWDAVNDATLDDAKQINLEEVSKVIDNGCSGASTSLKKLPEDRKKIVDEAELIISKGQANAEALAGSGYNIYYILLCKCEHFANIFNARKFDGILHKERN